MAFKLNLLNIQSCLTSFKGDSKRVSLVELNNVELCWIEMLSQFGRGPYVRERNSVEHIGEILFDINGETICMRCTQSFKRA